MTMYSFHQRVTPVVAIAPQTLTQSASPDNLVGSNIDLEGFNSAGVYVISGDIDELGSSPIGTAKIDLLLEHADDDGSDSPGTYSNVATSDVVGPSSVTNGIVATSTGENTFNAELSYVGEKRWIRLTLLPTGLTNGGPIGAFVMKGSPRHPS